MHFHTTRPVFFIKLQHQIKNVTYMLWVLVSQPINTSCNKLFTVILRRFLIESSDIFHHCELIEKQTH